MCFLETFVFMACPHNVYLVCHPLFILTRRSSQSLSAICLLCANPAIEGPSVGVMSIRGVVEQFVCRQSFYHWSMIYELVVFLRTT